MASDPKINGDDSSVAEPPSDRLVRVYADETSTFGHARSLEQVKKGNHLNPYIISYLFIIFLLVYINFHVIELDCVGLVDNFCSKCDRFDVLFESLACFFLLVCTQNA